MYFPTQNLLATKLRHTNLSDPIINKSQALMSSLLRSESQVSLLSATNFLSTSLRSIVVGVGFWIPAFVHLYYVGSYLLSSANFFINVKALKLIPRSLITNSPSSISLTASFTIVLRFKKSSSNSTFLISSPSMAVNVMVYASISYVKFYF